MSIIEYSSYSAESNEGKKYRAMLYCPEGSETATSITYRPVLYVSVNSSVTASYSGTVKIGGETYTGTCKTEAGGSTSVVCINSCSKTFDKGATETTATIQASVKSSSGSWTGESVTVSVTVPIPSTAPVTITFDANGGSGTVPTAISDKPGVAKTIPSNSLTRTGYAFDSWNTVSDGSGTTYATGSTITVYNDVTLYAQWKTTYVKPEIQNLVAFRTANASGGASPTVTSTGTTGFCKFELVGGADYTFTSATVQFGAAPAISMTKSGTTLYGYSDVGSIAEASEYTVKITIVVTGVDGISRTYTDSTYISKSVPIFDISSDGKCFSFFGPATDGLANPKLIINGELAFGTEADAALARTNLGITSMSGGETRTLLWTNASPESIFPPQTVDVDVHMYDFIEIVYMADNLNLWQIIERCEVGYDMIVEYLGSSTSNSDYLENYYRLVRVRADQGCIFNTAYTKKANSKLPSESDYICIPYKIYGIKEG